MAEEWRPLQAQGELLQIDGATEEGERGRGHYVGVVQSNFLEDTDSEGTEEQEGSGIDFQEPSYVRPAAVCEIKVPDLFSVGRKQRYGADRIYVIDGYV
jgi:hypothetical protein